MYINSHGYVKLLINILEQTNLYRLREEGYVPSEKQISSNTQFAVSVTPLIETISLKELSEKTATNFLKVNYKQI